MRYTPVLRLISRHILLIGVVCLALWAAPSALASNTLITICPETGIQQRRADFQPGGIIITTFDRANLWVYNIDRNARYPLPETAPCGINCHLSSDVRWITYLNAQDRIFSKMRLDGTQRTPLARYANEIAWWTEDTLLIWTPNHGAYLRAESGTDPEYLDVEGITSIQPGGYWGVFVEQQGDYFTRYLVNLQSRSMGHDERVFLGMDSRYFNAASWSPDGNWFAFLNPVVYDADTDASGAEIFAIRPGDAEPVQWTDFGTQYGAVRINGLTPGGLSWSPDGSQIAFWVMESLGPDPETDTGAAFLHILEVSTGNIRVYCGFSTMEHTPNPPRLVWSPDGTHIAFGGRVPGDNRGYLLLALDTAEGIFTELSAGIYPALGSADVIAWGLPPR